LHRALLHRALLHHALHIIQRLSIILYTLSLHHLILTCLCIMSFSHVFVLQCAVMCCGVLHCIMSFSHVFVYQSIFASCHTKTCLCIPIYPHTMLHTLFVYQSIHTLCSTASRSQMQFYVHQMQFYVHSMSILCPPNAILCPFYVHRSMYTL